MLISYKGAQPQELPKEFESYTVQQLTELGIKIVSELPVVSFNQRAVWNGNDWVVQLIPDPEVAIQRQWLKNEVVRLLKESDERIIELQEKSITIPKSISDYRDALREVPNTSNPFDVVWPEHPVVDITINDLVKAEAARRILEICPEWKQRNLTAQAAILAKKGEANWTPEEQAAWEAGEQIWAAIAIIRSKSDELENTGDIPSDFKDDKYWV
jgi:hypothetical protein